MRNPTLFIALFLPALAFAGPEDADVLFLGEQHDNPHHHARQAELVAELDPAALVFEMLGTEQAEAVTRELAGDERALEAALGWSESGWPDFSMYYPIFAAAPVAAYYGAAVPRAHARMAMESGTSTVFGAEAELYGLTEPLPEAQQQEREAMQMAAHCDALPETMLAPMVEIQRLRDARLAQTALQALRDTGGPVVVITGNGHARKDWGAPAALARVAPDVAVHSLGQGETPTGPPEGGFDAVEITAAVEREDPCAAFAVDGG